MLKIRKILRKVAIILLLRWVATKSQDVADLLVIILQVLEQL